MIADRIQTQRYALRSDVVATVLGDGAVLLDLQTKYFYRLNSSAWTITRLLENGATLTEILMHCHAAGAGPDDDPSIVALFERLEAERLVSPTSDEPAGTGETPAPTIWHTPSIEKQAEPLQKVIISAFDPSVPLVE